MKIERFNERLMNNKQDHPMVGEYVLANDVSGSMKAKDFVNNNIGLCTGIHSGDQFPFEVEYENLTPYLEKFFNKNKTNFSRNEILYWSDNKEELELILQSRKFNI